MLNNSFDSTFTNFTNAATSAPATTLLMFEPIDLDAIRPGMTLRFRTHDEIFVCTARVEAFSPVDEAIVVDAVYKNARITDAFRNYMVEVLVQA